MRYPKTNLTLLRLESLFARRLAHVWWPRFLVRAQALRDTWQGVLRAPLEPILHASRWRLRWVGIFFIVSNPVLFFVWGEELPQPWESIWLRALLVLLAVPLVYGHSMSDVASRRSHWLFGVLCWLQLPLFSSWMYLCNGGNAVWLAGLAAMLLVYYHLTDWRLATMGVASGGLVALLLFALAAPPGAAPVADTQMAVNAVVIAFAWSWSLALGLSAANLRTVHLRETLDTVRAMAHELRTPLTTLSLVGEALRNESEFADAQTRASMEKLAVRVHTMVRNMHHHVDMQISNARLLDLPPRRERMSAAGQVSAAVENYPFRTTRERQSVTVLLRRDFDFIGIPTVFTLVLDNLIKNSLRSVATSGNPTSNTDVVVEVGVLNNRGRIIVADRGVGIARRHVRRVFEPFFAVDKAAGRGLGLAFCHRVITEIGGTMHVKSTVGRGATFTIVLPMLK